jgi:hypothetical protein
LRNRAVELVEIGHAYLNSLDGARPDDLGRAFSEDFVCEDRKAGGVSFGSMDASEYLAAVRSNWDVGRRSPRFDLHRVIAVRGERLAAIHECLDMDDGALVHGITVSQLNDSLTQWQRIIWFDPEDVGAAIAELDRLHAEIEADNKT